MRLAAALLIALAAVVALPTAGAAAAEGGRLVLSATSSQSATHLGGGFSVQAVVHNSGDVSLSDVVVTVVLPEGVTETYHEGSYSDGENVDDSQAGQVLSYFFPTLEPGSDARVGAAWVDAVLEEDYDFDETVTARVRAYSPDSVLPAIVTQNPCSDDAAAACVVADVVPGPQLTLGLTADVESALPGETVRFSVEVSNTGVVDATADLVGVLPPELVFESSEVLVPSEYGDPAEGAFFSDSVWVAAGETLGFGVVSTLGDVPSGTVISFDLRLAGSGIIDTVNPCSDGSDSWNDNDSRACAEVAVARRAVVSPPAPRPGRPAGPSAPVPAPAPAFPAAGSPAAPATAPASASGHASAPAPADDGVRLLADTGVTTAPLGAALAALALGSLLLARRDVSSRRRRVSGRRAAPRPR